MTLEKLKTLFDIATSAATLIGAVVAAIWALNQWNVKLHEDRVNQSLQYLQRFDSEKMQEAKDVVDAKWLAARPAVMSMNDKSDWSGLDGLVGQMLTDPQYSNGMSRIISFYEELYVCIRNDLCDEMTALDLMGKDASGYWSQSYSQLRDERRARFEPCFGIGIEQTAQLWKTKAKSPESARGDWVPPLPILDANCKVKSS